MHFIPGKIDLKGAEQAKTLTSIDPSLQLIAKDHISVQTMSWIEVIRRKHGFHDHEGTLPPPTRRN
jgi:hypothetical protein